MATRVVVLMRHGEAAAGGDDRRRPLTAAGRANAAAMVGLLARGSLATTVTAVAHSGRVRAEQTAAILAARLGVDPARVRTQRGLDPGDDPQPALDQLAAADESVAVVSHLPFLPKLASLMLTGDEAALTAVFAEAGWMALVGSGRSWRLAALVNHEVVGV